MWPTLLLGGLLLGMRHALEADHVAAVATLATGSGSLRQTIRLGAVWGCGHALSLALFGSIVLLLNSVVPEHLARLLEFGVGAMLLVLGCNVLRRLARERMHWHMHRHGDGARHLHAHSHAGERHAHDRRYHEHEHRATFPLTALLVGVMHGMAGSAALILLSLATVHSAALGFLYLLVFGIGSIIGMAALSFAIAIPLRYSAPLLGRARAGLSAVTGIASAALGIVVMTQTGAVQAWLA